MEGVVDRVNQLLDVLKGYAPPSMMFWKVSMSLFT